MDAHGHGRVLVDRALDEREVVLVVEPVAVQVKLEIAVVGRQVDDLHALDEFLARAAVGDEVLDGAELQAVLLLEAQQFGHAGHRAVVVDDFRQHARRTQPRQPREIDGGLGVAGAAQHAAVAVAQRENVAGPGEVARAGCRRFGEQADGPGAVGGGDARGDALGGIDADRVGRAHPLGVGGERGHQRQFEPVEVRAFHRHADDAAGVLDHEGDALGGGFLGGEDEVALVFAVGVVGDDHGPARAHVFEHGFDGIELREWRPSGGKIAHNGRFAKMRDAKALRHPASRLQNQGATPAGRKSTLERKISAPSSWNRFSTSGG